jgi:hypothetical protein
MIVLGLFMLSIPTGTVLGLTFMGVGVLLAIIFLISAKNHNRR